MRLGPSREIHRNAWGIRKRPPVPGDPPGEQSPGSPARVDAARLDLDTESSRLKAAASDWTFFEPYALCSRET